MSKAASIAAVLALGLSGYAAWKASTVARSAKVAERLQVSRGAASTLQQAQLREPGSRPVRQRSPNARPQWCILNVMRSVVELENAVQQLSPDELAEFRRWFASFDAAAWDAQLESDASTGRLDSMAEEALSEFRQGRTRPL